MPKIAIGGQQNRAIGVMNRIVKLGRRSECAERDRNPADPRYREPGDNPVGPVGQDDADARALAEAEREQPLRSEEHTSELQSLMRISYAVFCLKKQNNKTR